MRPSIYREVKIRRSAFTLIELLVAIVIISILIGILLPSINAIRTRTRISQIRTDITDLESALADFKAHFGSYPPSRLVLSINADASTPAVWDNRSRQVIGKFWSEFNFNYPTYPSGFMAVGDGPKTLNGAECLVFFLGGVKDSYPSGALIGFSKSASRPFDNTSTSSRLGPFYEFNPTRLTEGTNSNGVDVYLDPIPDQTQPYLYLSANDGKGYRCEDWTAVGMTDVYRVSAGETDANGNCTLDSGEDTINSNGRFDYGAAWKDKDFQIISAGFDYTYGSGGVFDPKTADTVLIGPRAAERDNITNFHGGTLAN